MEIRRKKLEKTVIDYGGIENFVRERSRPDREKSLNPSYISQLINGTRKFGERAARNMEDLAGLPEYYFDKIDKSEDDKNTIKQEATFYEVTGIDPKQITIEQIELLRASLSVDKDDIDQAKSIVRTFIDKKTKKNRQNKKNN
jgi:hypothetical protein